MPKLSNCFLTEQCKRQNVLNIAVSVSGSLKPNNDTEKNNDNKKNESLGQTLGWQITQIPKLLNYDLQS